METATACPFRANTVTLQNPDRHPIFIPAAFRSPTLPPRGGREK
jgi:hypothetical protein